MLDSLNHGCGSRLSEAPRQESQILLYPGSGFGEDVQLIEIPATTSALVPAELIYTLT